MFMINSLPPLMKSHKKTAHDLIKVKHFAGACDEVHDS